MKSRFERNEIYCSWIEGAVLHEVELIGPDGQDPNLKREDSDVVGNVPRKTTGASHGLRIGEGLGVFRCHDRPESVEMSNNLIYRSGGGHVNALRDAEGIWRTGARVICGRNNWLPTGSLNVPAQWTGTKYGAAPGVVGSATCKSCPAGGSPLIDHWWCRRTAEARPPGAGSGAGAPGRERDRHRRLRARHRLASGGPRRAARPRQPT